MRYEKIISLPHHISRVRRRMPRENRAAQFAPYAALVGFEGEIAEEGRLTVDKTTLSEYEIERLDRLLREAHEGCIPVGITYFLCDKLKSGGNYFKVMGRVVSLDTITATLKLDIGTEIKFSDIIDVEELENEP